jgi:hypothetical protein
VPGIDYQQWGRDDYANIRRAGLLQTLADGKTLRLNAAALTVKLASHLVDNALVTTEREFDAQGITLNELMQKVCGLPITTKDQVQEDVQKAIAGQLGGTVNGKVQFELDGTVNVWLITKKVKRVMTDKSTGLDTLVAEKVWAVTKDPVLITTHSIVPSHKRVTAYEVSSVRNAYELGHRVPELAPQLVAIQQHRQQIAARAHTRLVELFTEGRTPAELEVFQAEVDRLVGELEANSDLADKLAQIEPPTAA